MSRAARVLVVAEARRWIGTPWHHAARVRSAGVDCGQLLAAVYEAAGVMSPVETAPYPRDFMVHRDEDRFVAQLLAHTWEVPTPGPGDVAIWRFGRCYSHAAIVVDWPTRIIHAYIPAGEVVEDDAQANLQLAHRPVRFFSPWRD